MNHDELMKKINDEYKETPLVAVNGQLAKLCEALKTKGFNFHPSAIIKELDTIVEKQFKGIVSDLFTGMSPEKIVDIKNEIIQWYNDEETRFSAFRESYLQTSQGPLEKSESAIEIDKEIIEEAPLAEVTPIKAAKSSTKHGKAVKKGGK